MQYPIEQGFVEVSPRVELHYEAYGQRDGQALLVVNDFFAPKHVWARYFAAVLPHYKLVVYDLRNQGPHHKALPALPAMRLADHAADLACLVEKLELERPIVVGVSTSTLIAKRFALTHPELLSALVLVSPFFSPFGEARKKLILGGWLRALEAGGPDFLFELLYAQTLACRTVLEGQEVAYLAQKAVFANTNSPEQLRQFLRLALDYPENAEELRKVKVPTLLMAGEQDFLNSPTSMALLGKLLPRAEVAIIDLCNHLPYFEAQTSFGKPLLRFIGVPEPACCA